MKLVTRDTPTGRWRLAKRNKPVAYEAPALKVLGTARELTLGPNGGPEVDSVFPHHSSP
jgi:hypothetical protein